MSRQVAGQGTKPHKWRGRWRAALTTGYDRDGKQIREWVYGRTQGECQDKLDELRKEHATLSDDAAADLNTGDYLREWLAGVERRHKKKTHDLYQRDVSMLGDRFMRKRLRRITVTDVEREILAIAREKDSNDAANRVRRTLRNALNAAIKRRLLDFNPATAVDALKHEVKAPTVWTGAEVLTFIQLTEVGRPLKTKPGEFEACELHALFRTVLVTGLRTSEVTALTWDDVDLERGFLSVNKAQTGTGAARTVGTPKSRAAHRLLGLPLDAVATLAAHRDRLSAQGLLSSGLVFPTSEGTMFDGRNVHRALRYWARVAGVTELTPHELRHTYASMAIAGGMSPVELARQLGHVDPGFTLRTYVHFFERAQARSVPSLTDLAGAVDNSVSEAGSGIPSGTASDSAVLSN